MYLWAVIAASVIGFLGNEAVAQFSITVGKVIDYGNDMITFYLQGH
jgi:hypothetical protein